jgi:DNA repair protein RadA/Sms
MTRAASAYVCQSCGAAQPKWAGRCEACGGWNTLVEEAHRAPASARKGGRKLAFAGLQGAEAPAPRLESGIAEFDRVAGGGLVAGSALLIGGDPGIGKSTLLLQVLAALAGRCTCLYISGEEAIDQLRLRAERLGCRDAPLALAAATAVGDIAATLDARGAVDVVVVDSVQTLYLDTLDSAPGTVAQVRASAQTLIGLAKRHGFVILLVGHVTKEGMIAGPRVLEHMVDTVLYFEGERGHPFRILRAVKNRFGATDEIGVFEMSDGGLREVGNPSALFLAERDGGVPGSCVFAGIEGTRPVLVEVQALIAPATFGTPRRAVVGWDAARLAMILAVLEARCGLSLAAVDVFLNIAGGLRVTEPAADLAVAAALVSAASARPLDAETIVFGEIGLGGEVRAVARGEARLKEAAKLGFSRAIVPARRGGPPAVAAIETRPVAALAELLALVRNGTRGPEPSGGQGTGRRTERV